MSMGKVGSWLENYWYHYKWHTIVVLFFVVVLAVTIPQFCAKEDADIQILYAGPVVPDQDTAQSFSNAFASLLAEDYNGDGKKLVNLSSIFVMTDAQIKELTDRGGAVSSDAMYNSRQQLGMYLFDGETLICLLDPAWYAQYQETGAFLPWEESLGYTPEGAMDAYAIRLKDTAFGTYFSETFAGLPEDTVLCMRRYPTANAVKNQKNATVRYEQHLAFFRALVTFDLKK
mgnify:CR=1 FL=1